MSGTTQIQIPIIGMTCAHCAETVQDHLKTVPGVKNAVVKFETARAFVTYDQARSSPAQLLKAIEASGYRTGAATATFRVEGIYCAGCIPQIEEALKRTPGVLSATLNPATEEARVEYVPSLTDLAALWVAVAAASPYTAAEAPGPSPEGMDHEAQAQEREYRSLMRSGGSGPLSASIRCSSAIPGSSRACVTGFPGEAHSSGMYGRSWGSSRSPC